MVRQKKEEELIGDRYEEYDWEKISNIDVSFEVNRVTSADVCSSVGTITSFAIVLSLKGRGMRGTSAASGRTFSTRPLIRLGGARRR